MLSRRELLQRYSLGFGGLALADLLRSDAAGGVQTHFAPKAKRVIFLFMSGGPSHLDLLDPKPAIHKYAGQRPKEVNLRTERVTGGLLPPPWKFRPGGKCGTQISDLLPHLRERADDICVVRSLVGGNPNHAPAANWLFSGRIDQIHPSLGAWTSFGLGAENRNLPMFVSMRKSSTASRYVRNGFLPGQFQGTPINAGGKTPQEMVKHLRSPGLSREAQRKQLEFIQLLNRNHRRKSGPDAALDARIRAMETAFRMQFSAGEALDLNAERKSVREAYGDGWFANACLLSRRLVERGVRYIHLEHSRWDDHDRISKEIPKHCKQVDQPMAALLADLKQRGLLDETLVIWGGEFGRTPVSENGDGRDHNHYGFSIWLAGGGIRGGITYGETDDFGFKAVKDRMTVHDLHATILHLLGLNHEKLTYRYSGRDFRLTDVHGEVTRGILA